MIIPGEIIRYILEYVYITDGNEIIRISLTCKLFRCFFFEKDKEGYHHRLIVHSNHRPFGKLYVKETSDMNLYARTLFLSGNNQSCYIDSYVSNNKYLQSIILDLNTYHDSAKLRKDALRALLNLPPHIQIRDIKGKILSEQDIRDEITSKPRCGAKKAKSGHKCKSDAILYNTYKQIFVCKYHYKHT